MSNEERIIQFRAIYEKEKPMYEAWGICVKEYILDQLNKSLYDVESIIKIPVTVRVKDTESMTAKAFMRANKHYTDPINQITDKVGIRFVVMVEEQIRIIQDIVEKSDLWESSKDVDYEEARETTPELFGYQSVHYIVRNRKSFERDNIVVADNIPCEIQIRTLEQHAYAELSHDYVYKSNKTIPPQIKRNLAKSMALNETTDDLFSKVYHMVSEEKKKYTELMKLLMELYPFQKQSEKINKEMYDNVEYLLDHYDIGAEKIISLINENDFILANIDERQELYLFRQPAVMILYYLINYHKNEFRSHWDYPYEDLACIYMDLGISDE